MSGRCFAVLSRPQSGIRAAAALTLARDHLGLNVVTWHKGRGFFALSRACLTRFLRSTTCRGNYARRNSPISWCSITPIMQRRCIEMCSGCRPAHPSRRIGRIDHTAPLLVAGRHQSGEICVRMRTMPTDCANVSIVAVRRQMRSAHPIGCLLSGGLELVFGLRSLPRARSREKNQRLTAFTGVPRRGFRRRRCRTDVMPTKRRMSKRSESRPAISTSTYVQHDAVRRFRPT